MLPIKSLEELRNLREEIALNKKQKDSLVRARILISTGSCGIAAGALKTLNSFLYEIEKNSLSGITISETGCIGLCSLEPVVQVRVGEGSWIIYQHVTPAIAKWIILDHILGGKVLEEQVIQV